MTSLAIDLKFARPAFTLDVGVEIPGQGITVLLGPSGSGKTTLMRLIAGFEKATVGSIRLGPRTWLDSDKGINMPVRKRNVGIVFQDYALFPNMTVAQNIGYGVARKARPLAVASWLERLELSGLETRYPCELSGGQRQRVALARTLATNPDLLLLDEPFSAVDAHLRLNLRAQLMELVATCKTPTILVTHDLDEARQIGDWIGVMTAGRLARFGAAQDVFNDPGDYGAATVLGWRNLLPLTADGDGPRQGQEQGEEQGQEQGPAQQQVSERCFAAGPWGKIQVGGIPASAKWLGIRAEHIGLGPGPFAQCTLAAKAVRCHELGAIRELTCRLPDNTPLCIHRPWNTPLPAPGETFMLHFPVQHLRVFGDSQSLVGPPLVGRRLRCQPPKDHAPREGHNQETTHVGACTVPSTGALRSGPGE